MKLTEDHWTYERLLEEIRMSRAKAARMRYGLEKQAVLARTSQLRLLAEARKWLPKARDPKR
jgi:hypothetical protein